MPTQAHRELEFFSPLGEDVLLLHKFKATEELGRLYKIELDLRSTQEDIDIEGSILGHNVTIRLDVSGSSQRYFNGYVTSFSQGENSEGFATYKAIVSPWIWFLQQTKDCQIFQEMSAIEIIEKVLGDNEYTDYELRLENSYRKRENTVQYRETSLNFISRLMEEEGIYYFFEHSNDRHKLILCDSSSAHQIIPTYDSISYYPPDATTVRNEEIINRWKQEYTVVSGSVALDDYDFENPKATIGNKYSKPKPHVNAEGEIFDYPGKYLTVDEGEYYARVRQEEIQCDYAIIKGKSTAREFSAGGLMKMDKHPREDQNIEYLITKVVHQADQDAFGSTKKGGSGFIYKNKFKVITAITPFRSKCKSKAPVVEGSQNAVVVGPSNEEIYCDKYGRIKVQFPWDRYGEADENSSCWIRVSQNWAGRKWGAIHIPRIGQEVIVDFLEGNPDRPLVTGKVYNADQMPPYDLPANKTQSGVKSRSTKKATDKNFNEIRMEDKKGSEELYIHAEKNHTNITESDRSENVGHDRSLTVGNDKTETIKKNKEITVDGTHTETIKLDTNIKITEGDYVHHVVAGTERRETKGLVTEVYGDSQNTTVENNIDITANKGKIDLTAEVEITLTVGESSLNMKKDGTIVLAGKDISITGLKTVEIGVGSQTTTYDSSKIESSGAEITTAAIGTHNLTGALIKIN